jgi:hypothetical protein
MWQTLGDWRLIFIAERSGLLRWIEAGRVQNEYRCGRSQRAADPERAVDGKIGPSAKARRDHFLNRRIDRTVFAAYSSADQHAKQTKAFQIPGKSRSSRDPRSKMIDPSSHGFIGDCDFAFANKSSTSRKLKMNLAYSRIAVE